MNSRVVLRLNTVVDTFSYVRIPLQSSILLHPNFLTRSFRMDHLAFEVVDLIDEIVHMFVVSFFVLRLGLIPVLGEVFIVVVITISADKVVSFEALIVMHHILTSLASEIQLVIGIVGRLMVDKLIYNLSLGLGFTLESVIKIAAIGSHWTLFNVLYHDVFKHASLSILGVIHRSNTFYRYWTVGFALRNTLNS